MLTAKLLHCIGLQPKDPSKKYFLTFLLCDTCCKHSKFLFYFFWFLCWCGCKYVYYWSPCLFAADVQGPFHELATALSRAIVSEMQTLNTEDDLWRYSEDIPLLAQHNSLIDATQDWMLGLLAGGWLADAASLALFDADRQRYLSV